ncbi:TrmH family RNA methyltransferase [Labilithrix luteola]|nr:RNA methyltransferase [Labilithrix luteola]
MRRKTPGMIPGAQLVPTLIARAERHDPERVIRLLEPFVLDRRRERLLSIIDQRLSSVQVVFDAPHDPHNGAAVVRSCEAFGVQFVHVVERKETFLASPTVTRGSEKWVDLRAWKSSEEVLAHLQTQGLEIIGAHPDGELTPNDLAGVPGLALVLGNERDGIAEDLAKACTRHVRVPMRGMVESLNVSVSAAILLAQATFGRKGDLSEADRRRLYARGLYFSVVKADEVLAADEIFGKDA